MPKDILISGYAHGAERYSGHKADAVSFTHGKGKIVMFGFRVQHRAQTEGTFQMLFNAIEWAGMEAGTSVAANAKRDTASRILRGESFRTRDAS